MDIDLPFEEEDQYELQTSGNFENRISALLNASWGRNEVHTPLQLAQYVEIIVNKGIKYKKLQKDQIFILQAFGTYYETE
ncbi:hypothetical protein SAMN04487919_13143 [Bacillus sp. ok061]|nr:hypothetical protein SAMN04487919_13143 [Bacillus sp. ok061]